MTDKTIQVLSVKELQHLLTVLSSLFDVARIVNPHNTAIITIKDDGSLEENPYTCFKVWGKNERCKNCTSREAALTGCRHDKYEYIKNSIFYVVSNPIAYRDDAGVEHPVVLEIVSHVSDHLASGHFGGRSLIEIIDENQRMIFTDALTGALNRRCLFEKIVKYDLSQTFAIIMLDVHRFKEINDTLGHLVGDHVLIAVASRLKAIMRAGDRVVRYGGDEFLIVLNHCNAARAQQVETRIREALARVPVEQTGQTVSCDIGTATTDSFDGQEESFSALLAKADHAMYEEKRQHYAQEGLQPPPR